MKGNPYLHYASLWVGIVVGVLGFKLLNVFISVQDLEAVSKMVAAICFMIGLPVFSAYLLMKHGGY